MTATEIHARSAREVARAMGRTTVPRQSLALLVGETAGESIAITMTRAGLVSHLMRRGLHEMADHAAQVDGIPLVIVQSERATIGALDLEIRRSLCARYEAQTAVGNAITWLSEQGRIRRVQRAGERARWVLVEGRDAVSPAEVAEKEARR